MDFVPNHTGLEHPWFIASATATDPSDPYWNHYIWQECGINGTSPPTNWVGTIQNAISDQLIDKRSMNFKTGDLAKN